MKFILGKKIRMSQIFHGSGKVIPVTIVKAGPCQVTQVKTIERDGYLAVQVGFGVKNKQKKPQQGHLKNSAKSRYLKEFPIINSSHFQEGQSITATIFRVGEKVKVTGVAKGKGFQGVVKRHGFSGSPASHGHKDQLRRPGSIGATDPARVFKGMKMAGRTGGQQVTVKNLKIIKIDPEKNYLYLKGAVPGAFKNLLLIQGPGKINFSSQVTSVEKKETNNQPASNQNPQADNQS